MLPVVCDKRNVNISENYVANIYEIIANTKMVKLL